jgi:hypothetical protein
VPKNKQKSTTASAEKQLKATVKKLRAQLAVAEKSAEKWKSRAKDHKSVAVGAKSELTAMRRRLDKAEANVAKWKERAQAKAPTTAGLLAPPKDGAPKAATSAPSPVAAPPASPVTAPTAAQSAPRNVVTSAAPSSGARPDDSWTVTALRAEARSRGVVGYSRKTKAQLLADLGG